ncbi:GNAT family N-acetyltransferase [Shimia abyssi]|uniref:RimJ/RimL family protein N-acetyltransferase n=1 Tax=Shimia abyssi TaxID=1662395 RepID=A0A2P8FKR6_9RHOB|nr:GNAT family N-acetyltransferase [Shimia abyssi]PSL22289.1 RimJ/RimL family protein N-acetyltransferase [Shimia abyssi]
MTAPTLTTSRLTLRHHRLEDFEPMTKHFASDWAKYMGGPISDDELWRWLGAEVVSWDWLGFGSWAVDLTATGALIGQVGINKPPRFPEIELGWCVFPEAQQKGYAFEAATAVRDWAFDVAGHSTLVSYIDADNAASIALAERLGALRDDIAERPEPDDLVYRHIAGDRDGGMEAYA